MAIALGPIAASHGYRLKAFDQIASTNAEAMAAAIAGERGPLWFVTTEQTAGRGRRGRAWVAPRGNLAASILELVDAPPAVAATLGFVAGLAIYAALRTVSAVAPEIPPPAFALKWPNDVLADGAKLSGILLEAETVGVGALAVVAGIGTNIVAAPDNTPYAATSLHALGVQTSAEALFAALSDGWVEYRGIWDNGRGFAEIRRLWLARAAGVGQPVSIKGGRAPVSGVFETIDSAGCMIVATADGRRVPVAAGEVFFGTAASAGTE
ncbi:MAG TPA: biotin--[acetyl-CoA-carboxylase] ligase [Xanthobacteraceae bacterium]|nr:biotin--[acetyl-CoA-carboxylase] ligase [Xanthobacteraceae bacterium]